MPLSDPTLLTCSYVLLNKPTPGTSPELQFSPQFVATLFDLPQSTGVSSTGDGLVIMAPGKNGPRLFSFNPIKIQIQNDNSFALQQTSGRVFQHLKRIGFPIDPSAHGLNYEFEFKLSGVMDSSKWLADRFAVPGLPGLATTPTAKAIVDSLDLRFEGVGELQILKIQPRAGKPDTLFSYANLHFKPGRVMQGEQLENELTRCFEVAIAQVASLLGV